MMASVATFNCEEALGIAATAGVRGIAIPVGRGADVHEQIASVLCHPVVRRLADAAFPSRRYQPVGHEVFAAKGVDGHLAVVANNAGDAARGVAAVACVRGVPDGAIGIAGIAVGTLHDVVSRPAKPLQIVAAAAFPGKGDDLDEGGE